MTAAKHTMRHLGAALLGVVLTLLLALCMGLPAAAFAAPADSDTTYTIRLYGGNRGTVNGQDMVEWTGVHYGDTVDLGQASIAVTDGKYYAKGARPAGLDNVKDVVYVADVDANGKLSGTVTVTEDADYVIAYGVLADRVEYTVRYVDAAGNELAASQKFMGDIAGNGCPVFRELRAQRIYGNACAYRRSRPERNHVHVCSPCHGLYDRAER